MGLSKNQKLNIIGGSGFIGTVLISQLLETCNKDKIKILDKVSSRKYPDLSEYCDVRSQSNLKQSIEEDTIIINLAAEHKDDVSPASLYYDVNVNGAENVCDAARSKNIKTIVFTSSVAVYGFAPIGTSEDGRIEPFNDYGKSKIEAEQIYKSWQLESPHDRTLVIIRPTVVFGENNRGNVYNLIRQISKNKFIMIGDGENRKSIAYVENIASFIKFCSTSNPGIHLYNYADKPDYNMNELVVNIKRILGLNEKIRCRIPFFIAILLGRFFDIFSKIIGRRFAISRIRIEKFCANSVYNTGVDETGFAAPYALDSALEKTIIKEFQILK